MPRLPTIESFRETRPTDRDWLWEWIRQFLGVKFGRRAVCQGHCAPFDPVADQFLDRPPITLVLGSRGGGKSFGSGIATHLDSRFHPRHDTRILGGSKSQSEQIYNTLSGTIQVGGGQLGSDADTIESLLKESASYRNGSNVKLLAASDKQVRGPHIPVLRLDEVDEIDPSRRQAAMGMNMAMNGYSACVHMASTYHRVGGPMADLIGQAKDGKFPLYTFCVFEVLERCSIERSGTNLENCSLCPLITWCHEERLSGRKTADGKPYPPKAKISRGHYSIDSLIQKVMTVSRRVFESDYLCKGPKADNVWFTEFDPTDGGKHVGDDAQYDNRYPVWRSIDSGVCTGAVLFQLIPQGHEFRVVVFADYFREGLAAESVARELVNLTTDQCGTYIPAGVKTVTDPAGNARNAIGPSVLSEYKRGGLGRIDPWPIRPVVDSLALLESFVGSAAGTVELRIHPRCKPLIEAMTAYRRATRGTQLTDYPVDPQHPFEDMVDALRGGLCAALPNGRKRVWTGPTASFGKFTH